jgi:hypothetical protein
VGRAALRFVPAPQLELIGMNDLRLALTFLQLYHRLQYASCFSVIRSCSRISGG